ncbi:MAG: glycine cleavage system protein GcvH [Desulfobulbaceae bacterium]|nr:glycine cleavage system protein GcvH [Desulfobulbaceae bacterium]
MKEVNELDLPADIRYAESHEWVKKDGDEVTVGLSDYAQDQMGDIVYVELPEPGASFNKGDEFGTVESVKAVSEMFIPVGGEIVGVNENLADGPELVNSAPYAEGWMIRIKPDDMSEYDNLMDKDAYLKKLKG